MRIHVVLLALALPLAAAAPEGFHLWSAAELKTLGQKLADKNQKLAVQPLADYGNHNVMLAFRSADGQAELHYGWVDVIVVQSGAATLIVGGEMVNPKTSAKGEIRGDSITGGTKQALAPGDVVHIPAKTPHQLLVPSGGAFSYFVVKVAPSEPRP